MPKLKLLAHRGYAAQYPENTREALNAAIAAGARHVEFDIQLSADGVPVLLHDGDFQRTAGINKSVFELTSAQIAELDVCEAGRFGNKYSDIRAPTLEVVVDDLTKTPDVRAFVELKKETLAQVGADAFLDAVLPVLEPIAAQTVVITFERPLLEGVRERTEWPIGWALRQWDDEHHRYAERMQPEYLFCNVTRLPEAPTPLWPGGWTWVIYEITDAADALGLAERGVGMIETMELPELQASLDDMLKAAAPEAEPDP